MVDLLRDLSFSVSRLSRMGVSSKIYVEVIGASISCFWTEEENQEYLQPDKDGA